MCARASGLSTFSSPRLFRNHLRFAASSPPCVSVLFLFSLCLSLYFFLLYQYLASLEMLMLNIVDAVVVVVVTVDQHALQSKKERTPSWLSSTLTSRVFSFARWLLLFELSGLVISIEGSKTFFFVLDCYSHESIRGNKQPNLIVFLCAFKGL